MSGVSQSTAALLEAYQEQIEIYKHLLKAEGERNLPEDAGWKIWLRLYSRSRS